MRPMVKRDRQHGVGRRHFEIERQGNLAHERSNVGVGDVAAILAQMRGDAVGACRHSQFRCAHRIGMRTAPRIADGRDMVDVHAEAQRPFLHHADQPRARSTELITGVARKAAMMLVKWRTFCTSMSTRISKKSCDRLVILRLVMLPPPLPMTVVKLPRLPGSLPIVTLIRPT